MSLLLLTKRRSTLLRDSFTGADATALASHTPEVGGPWTDHNSVLHLTGNALAVAAGGAGSGSAQVNRANVRIVGTLRTSSLANPSSVSLLTRFVDASNFWAVLAYLDAGAFEIYEVVAGVFTQRATTPKVFAINTDYTLELVDTGASIAGTVNGGSAVSFATTANNTTTRKGVRLFNTVVADVARLNDVTIWGL
jgi:hypothetical protein